MNKCVDVNGIPFPSPREINTLLRKIRRPKTEGRLHSKFILSAGRYYVVEWEYGDSECDVTLLFHGYPKSISTTFNVSKGCYMDEDNTGEYRLCESPSDADALCRFSLLLPEEVCHETRN